MPDWLVIVFLGLIEGVTEFLPVSSTGHLLIAEQFVNRQSDLFNVVIQAGAVLAVLPLFPQRLAQFFTRFREDATRDYLWKLFTAFAITGAGGLVLEKLHFKLPEKIFPVAVALLAGGVLFVVIEWLLARPGGSTQITWAVALAVGVGQLVAAVFPGASRSGTTILLMLVLGLSRPAATEFSFLVGIPTMLAASGLKILKALHHPPPGTPPENWAMVALGAVVAAVVSFVAVKWLLRYVQTHTFTGFGWYRIALGAALLAWVFLEK
ncbi:MAG: undecaprenyl-diphosphate phosphatase [Verrucomicrobia bacterium]|nr:undecaprenyl-diphosphate phosphatase [Verrucomicrobiota bacterium]